HGSRPEPALFGSSLGLALRIAPGDGLPLIPKLLASCQCQLHLGMAPRREIDPERHQRPSLLLDLAARRAELLRLDAELAGARRLAVPAVAVRVRAHAHVVEKDFAPHDPGQAAPPVEPSLADGLDPGSAEDDTGCVALLDVISVAALAV